MAPKLGFCAAWNLLPTAHSDQDLVALRLASWQRELQNRRWTCTWKMRRPASNSGFIKPAVMVFLAGMILFLLRCDLQKYRELETEVLKEFQNLVRPLAFQLVVASLAVVTNRNPGKETEGQPAGIIVGESAVSIPENVRTFQCGDLTEAARKGQRTDWPPRCRLKS